MFWNKEQAELLVRIAFAGGSCASEVCHREVVQSLIAAGFAKEEAGDRVSLTNAGLARARELRRSHR
jgi:hypothetical protein